MTNLRVLVVLGSLMVGRPLDHRAVNIYKRPAQDPGPGGTTRRLMHAKRLRGKGMD